MFLVPSSQLFRRQHNLRKSHWWKLSIAKNSIIPFPDLIFELAQNQEFPSPSDTGSLCSHVVQVISFDGFISIKMLMVISFDIYIHVSIIMISKCYHCQTICQTLWVSVPTPDPPILLFATCCLYLKSNWMEESKEGRNSPYIKDKYWKPNFPKEIQPSKLHSLDVSSVYFHFHLIYVCILIWPFCDFFCRCYQWPPANLLSFSFAKLFIKPIC